MLKFFKFIIKYHIKNSRRKYNRLCHDGIVFLPINYNDLFNVVNSNDYHNSFLFFGRPTCPHCRVFIPMLYKIARNQKLKIYYFDTDSDINGQAKKLLLSLGIVELPQLIQLKNKRPNKSLKVYNNENAINAWVSTVTKC